MLAELASRGHRVVEEPGRRIIAEELKGGGRALPWTDLRAFARRAVDLSLADRASVADWPGFVFLDRGLVDAAAILEYLGDSDAIELCYAHRYNRQVFLTPPWPQIYTADGERRHGLDEAVAEYERLQRVYPSLDYAVGVLPKRSVAQRADFILAALAPVE